MFFVLHSLNTDDVFVDIGANVGIFSILAAGEKGANVISIEPIKKTYDILQANVKLNNLESKIQTLNIGISDSKGVLNFVSEHGTINHVVSDLEKNHSKTESVFVDSLDNICEKTTPLILKIDVEGFETNVINGAKNIIENIFLKAIIIELNGLGIRYGFNEIKIHDYLINQGFNCYNYEPYSRSFKESNFDGIHNTIYIRDINFFKARVKNCPQINVIDQFI
jgi:FkbM family methyltransferase